MVESDRLESDYAGVPGIVGSNPTLSTSLRQGYGRQGQQMSNAKAGVRHSFSDDWTIILTKASAGKPTVRSKLAKRRREQMSITTKFMERWQSG